MCIHLKKIAMRNEARIKNDHERLENVIIFLSSNKQIIGKYIFYVLEGSVKEVNVISNLKSKNSGFSGC